jgi:phosphomevalonate kinase
VPYFDAEALRANGRKLGLGSSAAILVASLAASDRRTFAGDRALREQIFATALAAHQRAQGGGSGIDVAASTWGGTLVVRRGAGAALDVDEVAFPPGLVVEVWASGSPASTPHFLAKVAALRERSPDTHAAIMGCLRAAASIAAEALRRGQLLDLMAQLRIQCAGLGSLGDAAGVPIVTTEVRELATCVGRAPGAVLPSGAGGGDIVLWVSTEASPPEFRGRALALGHFQVPLALHARGVHRLVFEHSASDPVSDAFSEGGGLHRGS